MISSNFKKRLNTSIVLFFLIFLILNYQFFLAYTLIIIGIYSIIEFANILKRIFKKKFIIVTSNMLFILYIFLICFLFFIFSTFFLTKIFLYSILFSCVASDIGGYIVGKIVKGPKLTKISPNKTRSGAIGSLFFSSVTFSAIIFLFTNNFNYKTIFCGVLISIACQFGDLIFSFLKWKAKLKDTGNILPGHGGMLDRVDGYLIGIPIGFLSLVLIL